MADETPRDARLGRRILVVRVASLGAAAVVAVSRDGKRAAVRVTSAAPVTEFGRAVLYRVVDLFE